MSDWQITTVTITTGNERLDAEAQFNAYTTGETWNGWIVPYFTESEGKRVAAWSVATARNAADPDVQDIVRWDEGGQSFILDSSDASGETDSEFVAGHYVDEIGSTLFDIGARRWTWETVGSLELA